jgi:hypothetical protein
MGALAAIAMLLAFLAMPAAAEAPTSPVPRSVGTGVKDQVRENILRLLPNPLKVRGVDTSAGRGRGRLRWLLQTPTEAQCFCSSRPSSAAALTLFSRADAAAAGY